MKRKKRRRFTKSSLRLLSPPKANFPNRLSKLKTWVFLMNRLFLKPYLPGMETWKPPLRSSWTKLKRKKSRELLASVQLLKIHQEIKPLKISREIKEKREKDLKWKISVDNKKKCKLSDKNKKNYKQFKELSKLEHLQWQEIQKR